MKQMNQETTAKQRNDHIATWYFYNRYRVWRAFRTKDSLIQVNCINSMIVLHILYGSVHASLDLQSIQYL